MTYLTQNRKNLPLQTNLAKYLYLQNHVQSFFFVVILILIKNINKLLRKQICTLVNGQNPSALLSYHNVSKALEFLFGGCQYKCHQFTCLTFFLKEAENVVFQQLFIILLYCTNSITSLDQYKMKNNFIPIILSYFESKLGFL